MTYLDALSDAARARAAGCGIGHAVPLMSRPNRRVWLAKRRRGITATDVPAILGLSPWATPLDVWMDKTGRAEPTEVTYAMERGTALEALLLAEYQRRTGADMLTVPPLAGHPTDPLAMASLDGAAVCDGEQRLVEVKTAGWRTRDDWWDESRQIPDHYLAQVGWQQYVCGVEVADVIVDVAGDVRMVRGIERSRDFEAYVAPLMAAWWRDHVLADVPPPPDPVRDYDALNLLWSPVPKVEAVADPDTFAACIEYAAHSAAEAAAKAAKREPRGLVRIALGEASRLVDDQGRSWAYLNVKGALTIKPPKEREDTTP